MKESESHKRAVKRYYESHKEQIKKYNKDYSARKYKEHREEYLEKSRGNYKRNRKQKLGYAKHYRETHREQIISKTKAIRTKNHKELIDMMGGKCIKCGFDDLRVLEIDHINGGGNVERRNIKSPSKYYEVIKQSILKGENKYQLLCANCNKIKRYENNECPRQRRNIISRRAIN